METHSQSYGTHLPDQVDRIGNLFEAHIGLLGDVHDLYRDRAALEREYAQKLQVLARKASEKKSKNAASVVLGDDPTKAWDENTLRQSSLDAAYTQIVDSMVNTAQDHVNIADAMTLQVVDVLKVVEKKNEEMKKKQIQFYQKLLSDRDRVYSERIKTKQKYDEECLEVESYRQKQGRAQDDRHADRAAKQYEQQRTDMMNSKNTYLISTAVSNKTKSKFYVEDLPALEDQFQDLQTRLVDRLVKIVIHAQALQTSHHDVIKGRLASVETAFGSVAPSKDQDLFIDHNVRPFNVPTDWTFEPCSSHYDTEEMNIEPAPKVFLQNKLGKCRQKMDELTPLIDAKTKELDQLSRLVSAYSKDRSLGNSEDILDNYLDTKQQLTFFKSSHDILAAELETISSALGDDIGGNQPHTFKSSSFSIPTQCGYCKTSIWGLSKQGKTCKACGLSVHSKCELKVPAECTGSRGVPSMSRSSTVSRTSTGSSTSTVPKITTPTPSSFVKQDAIPAKESYPLATVLFDFTPTSPFELGVSEGTPVHVLEEDDGSGWVKVSDQQGGKGLVPASYIELSGGVESKKSAAGQPSGDGSGKYVRGLYDYVAQGSDELGLKEGELIELSSGPTGGEFYGDGWWEGINSRGRKGIFPSNYVELV